MQMGKRGHVIKEEGRNFSPPPSPELRYLNLFYFTLHYLLPPY